MKRKAIVLSLVLAALTLTTTNLNAQDRGLFGRGAMPELYNDNGTMNRGTGITDDGITNADFGEEAPLGSGIAILIGAGLGYVALKKKED